jgi:hypothetical protein
MENTEDYPCTELRNMRLKGFTPGAPSQKDVINSDGNISALWGYEVFSRRQILDRSSSKTPEKHVSRQNLDFF